MDEYDEDMVAEINHYQGELMSAVARLDYAALAELRRVAGVLAKRWPAAEPQFLGQWQKFAAPLLNRLRQSAK